MNLEDLKNKRVAILGYGTEGKALLNFLGNKNLSSIAVFDEKNDFSTSGNSDENVVFRKCSLNEADLGDFDYVFRSPGIKFNRVRKLVTDESRVTSATNLFFEECRARIIGVTGTKGKSTTAKIIEKILQLNGRKVRLGGNIGVVPLEFIDSLEEDDFVILELSSFQLEDLRKSPWAAVILPISSDHLDYHEDVEEYGRAKSAIARYQKEGDVVIFYDSGKSKEIASLSKATPIPYRETDNCDGCSVAGESVVCNIGSDTVTYNGVSGFSTEYKIPIIDIIAALAFASSQGLGVDLENVFSGFKKMPYRIELVRDIDGVKFYNDSASTNPVSTIAAAKTITEPYFLIAGGSSKNLDFSAMGEYLSGDNNLKSVFLTGETADAIRNSLTEHGFLGKIVLEDSLDSIVAILEKERPASVRSVLFSPASASFDHYQNYMKRGEHFTNLISKL